MGVTLRDAAVRDVEFIRTALAALGEEMRAMEEARGTGRQVASDFNIDEHLRRDAFILSFRDGEPTGLISIRFSYPAPSSSLISVVQRANIDTLYVVPGHRRRGTAMALLKAAEAKCTDFGAKGISLGFIGGNLAAERLYLKAGYLPSRQLMWLNLG